MRARTEGVDPHTLAGAYALDAVDDVAERRRFERHLAACGECEQEIATLTETVALLGAAVATDPPTGLRARVLAEIEQVRQLPPSVVAVAHARRAWRVAWRPWLAAVGAAAALAVTAVLGAATIEARHELDQARHAEQRITAVLTAGDARTVTAPAAGRDGRGTVVVSRSQGAMVFWAAGLGEPPQGRVYQLWRIAPGRITSAGLLASSGSGGTVPVLAATGAEVGRVGVTVEPAGGSRQPTTTPLLVVEVPAA
ncbi:anti-sigma factor [Nonomuraea ceibae]|uniref:anti-sigma factor n=1 Tax=Nonomuraea ceibae TaxID=1935170 RepID=UPI001C5EFBA2|nr:anti-sigma factor [Nonomuraea ceibae]